MSWLFFIDESGHDHNNMPLEVRGGIALHVSQLFSFVRGWERAIERCFGSRKSEIKGYRLLDKKRFRWAKLREEKFSQQDRLTRVKKFFASGEDEIDRAAYGQACMLMTHCIFKLLKKHQAKIFACAIPKGVRPPKPLAPDQKQNFLRKDRVFLFQRFFYFLEEKQDHGLIIMDELEKKTTDDSSLGWPTISRKPDPDARGVNGLFLRHFLSPPIWRSECKPPMFAFTA